MNLLNQTDALVLPGSDLPEDRESYHNWSLKIPGNMAFRMEIL